MAGGITEASTMARGIPEGTTPSSTIWPLIENGLQDSRLQTSGLETLRIHPLLNIERESVYTVFANSKGLLDDVKHQGAEGGVA